MFYLLVICLLQVINIAGFVLDDDECPEHYPLQFIKSNKNPAVELGVSGIFDQVKPYHRYHKNDNYVIFLQDETARAKRIDHLEQILHSRVGQYVDENDKLISLTIITKGFLFVFLNWICSIEHYQLNLNSVRQNMLIICADSTSYLTLKAMGFHVIDGKKFYLPPSFIYQQTITERIPTKFGYNGITLQKGIAFAVANDLLALGYDFFFTDADVIWRKDPRPTLKELGKRVDFLVTTDGIPDSIKIGLKVEGPFNGGVLYGRSTCRSKIAMQSIVMNIDLMEKYEITDQSVMNLILYRSRKFRLLRVNVLPEKLFVNGHTYHKNIDEIYWKDVIMIHCSWTNNFIGKIVKLRLSDDWFYEKNQNCSFYREEFDLPKLLKVRGVTFDEKVNCAKNGNNHHLCSYN